MEHLGLCVGLHVGAVIDLQGVVGVGGGDQGEHALGGSPQRRHRGGGRGVGAAGSMPHPESLVRMVGTGPYVQGTAVFSRQYKSECRKWGGTYPSRQMQKIQTRSAPKGRRAAVLPGWRGMGGRVCFVPLEAISRTALRPVGVPGDVGRLAVEDVPPVGEHPRRLVEEVTQLSGGPGPGADAQMPADG